MIIKALKTFSDGVISMHEGEIANVPDVKAQLFIAEGYAIEYTGEAGEIDLSAYAKKTDLPTISDLADDPISGLRTVSGTFRNAYNDAICEEQANNVVNVTIPETSKYSGAFFNVEINPSIDNTIEFTIDNKTSGTLYLSCFIISGNQYVFAPTSNIPATKGVGTYTQTISKDYILEKGLMSPMVIGVTTKTISTFDVSLTNTYGDTATILSLKNDVDELKKDESKTLSGKKAIFLGDSITALTGERSWVDKFCNLTGVTKVANTAVNGATLNDKSDTVLDGDPTSGTSANNTLSNQVQKIINNTYETPDLIVIAIGTNGGITADDTRLKASYLDGSNNLVALTDVDRTHTEGAFRWANETLHNLYPSAVICWCNPIQGSKELRDNVRVTAWCDALRTLTQYGAVNNIETNRCGIIMANEVENTNGESLIDGLHPNANGATKMAQYNANAISRLFL